MGRPFSNWPHRGPLTASTSTSWSMAGTRVRPRPRRSPASIGSWTPTRACGRIRGAVRDPLGFVQVAVGQDRLTGSGRAPWVAQGNAGPQGRGDTDDTIIQGAFASDSTASITRCSGSRPSGEGETTHGSSSRYERRHLSLQRMDALGQRQRERRAEPVIPRGHDGREDAITVRRAPRPQPVRRQQPATSASGRGAGAEDAPEAQRHAALRLEQDSSGGFLAADLGHRRQRGQLLRARRTGGSKCRFRIRPGALPQHRHCGLGDVGHRDRGPNVGGAARALTIMALDNAGSRPSSCRARRTRHRERSLALLQQDQPQPQIAAAREGADNTASLRSSPPCGCRSRGCASSHGPCGHRHRDAELGGGARTLTIATPREARATRDPRAAGLAEHQQRERGGALLQQEQPHRADRRRARGRRQHREPALPHRQRGRISEKMRICFGFSASAR